jgi:hypothetical protein
MINVITPATIPEIPSDFEFKDALELKVDENEYFNKENNESYNQIKLVIENKIISMGNLEEAVGLTWGVGGIMKIILPNTLNLKVGNEYEIELIIIGSVKIKVTRTLN